MAEDRSEQCRVLTLGALRQYQFRPRGLGPPQVLPSTSINKNTGSRGRCNHGTEPTEQAKAHADIDAGARSRQTMPQVQEHNSGGRVHRMLSPGQPGARNAYCAAAELLWCLLIIRLSCSRCFREWRERDDIQAAWGHRLTALPISEAAMCP